MNQKSLFDKHTDAAIEMVCLWFLESQRVCLLGYFFSMSIENCDPQSLEPRRGGMCRAFPLAGPFHRGKVILKSTINDPGFWLSLDFALSVCYALCRFYEVDTYELSIGCLSLLPVDYRGYLC